MKIIAIVGMPGSGKTEALKTIEKLGIPSFNMGDVVTKIEPAKRGIVKIDEYIENEIRMDIRKQFGPAAVAVITSEEVDKMNSDIAAIVGLHSFAELRQVFPSADKLDHWIIFNIGGNKYRLITSIHFNRGKVYVRHVLSHAEYDRGDWKNDTRH